MPITRQPLPSNTPKITFLSRPMFLLAWKLLRILRRAWTVDNYPSSFMTYREGQTRVACSAHTTHKIISPWRWRPTSKSIGKPLKANICHFTHKPSQMWASDSDAMLLGIGSLIESSILPYMIGFDIGQLCANNNSVLRSTISSYG